MSSETVLAELRVATQADHQRIEDVLRLEEPMPLERYAAIMAGFDAFLRAWEPRIQAALPPRLRHWFRARRRGGFAAADVQWLRDVAGVEVPMPEVSAIALLPLDALPQVLGSLYVIEGSALGGRVVAPQLQATLGLRPGQGASYFHGFGGATSEMWRDFRVLAALEIGETGHGIVRACRSARRTFALLNELFAPLAPEPDLALPVDDAPDTIIDVLGRDDVSGTILDVVHDERTLIVRRGLPDPDRGPDTIIDVLGPVEDATAAAPPAADGGPDTVIDVAGLGDPPDTMFDVLDDRPGGDARVAARPPPAGRAADAGPDTVIDVAGLGEPPDTMFDVITLHLPPDPPAAPRR